MRLTRPREVAAGIAAVTKAFRYGMSEAGLLAGGRQHKLQDDQKEEAW